MNRFLTDLPLRIALCVTMLLSLYMIAPVHAASPYVFARDGKAASPIIISEKANDSVKASANRLAGKLSQMLGSDVTVKTGDGKTGIVLAMAGDFADLPKLDLPADTHPLAAAQSYRIITDSGRVVIVGQSEVAVEFGIWHLLAELGYRQLAPHEAWEVVPDLSKQTVSLDEDTTFSPDYFDRRIWYAWGGDMTRKHMWNFKNRMNHHGWRVDFMPEMPAAWKRTIIQNHHMYHAIIQQNKAAFATNPEYYALVKGERKGSKLCIANPVVQQMTADYALNYFAKNPDQLSISMEPTDGYGWCECEDCAKLGSSADRMILLANHVAKALEKDHADKYIGVLAYAHHAMPTTLEVHPKVVVACATQLSGNIPIEDRLKGWGEKTEVTGVYDYFAVAQWHVSMPGRMRGGNTQYISQKLPEFHKLGAQVFIAEAGDCWGPNALGYYLTAQLLWETDNAANTQAIIDDFLDNGFGPAAPIMGKWYELMDDSYNDRSGGLKPGSLEYFQDRRSQMYALLLQAHEKAQGRRDIQTRIDHLLIYTRVVDLWLQYRHAAAKQKDETPQAANERSQEAKERLIHFAWQSADTGMAHWHGLRGVIPHGTKIDVKNPPAWASPQQQDAAYWQGVTPQLIEEIHARAREVTAAKP